MFGAPQRDAIAFRETEMRLAVAVDGRVAPVVDGDRDQRAVGNGDRPIRQRMRRDRHQRERRHLRRQNRSARRQRVGGRPGGRRDDDAVGAHRIDQPAVDLDRAFDHRAERSAVDDDVVQRGSVLARTIGALDRGGEQRPPLLDVAAVEHRAERRLHPRERNVGEEAQPTLIDADQRHVVRGQLAGKRQHRPVTAHDDRKIGFHPELCRRDGWKLGLPGEPRRLVLPHDAMAAGGQESGEALQRRREPGAAGTADEHDASKACRGQRRHGGRLNHTPPAPRPRPSG